MTVSQKDFLIECDIAFTLCGLPTPDSDTDLLRHLVRFFKRAQAAAFIDQARIDADRLLASISHFPDCCFLASRELMNYLGLDFKTNPPANEAGRAYKEIIAALELNGWAPAIVRYEDKLHRGYRKGSSVLYLAEASHQDGDSVIALRNYGIRPRKKKAK